MVSSIPADCVDVLVGGVDYKHCGSNWLRPEYRGYELVYVAVADPR